MESPYAHYGTTPGGPSMNGRQAADAMAKRHEDGSQSEDLAIMKHLVMQGFRRMGDKVGLMECPTMNFLNHLKRLLGEAEKNVSLEESRREIVNK